MNEEAQFCTCTMDADGGCPACQKELLEALLGFLEAQRASVVASKRLEAICKPCHKRYGDYALARALPRLLEPLDRAQAVKAMKHHFAAFGEGMGIQMPLTEKAWRDYCLQRGWNDSLIE